MLLPIKKKKKFKQPKSSGCEKKIIKFLTDNNIKFVREKKFPGLLSMFKGELRFDFYIKEMNLLLEFDGPHHTSSKVYGKKKFINTYINDNIKNHFAKRQNINLIRINYTENLTKRLEDIFKNKNFVSKTNKNKKSST